MNFAVLAAIGGVVVIAYFLIEASNSMSSGSSSTGSAHQISLAIGVAEGGYDANGNNLGNGTLPSVNHNPGDLTVDVNNTGSGTNNGFVVYADDATGYAALDYQVGEWLDGTSANAGPDSTIDQISQFYTTTDPASWAANVAATLGVPSSTPIGQIGNPAAVASAAVAQVPSPVSEETVTSDTSNDESDAQDDSENEVSGS
jgi:hypothetical protein